MPDVFGSLARPQMAWNFRVEFDDLGLLLCQEAGPWKIKAENVDRQEAGGLVDKHLGPPMYEDVTLKSVVTKDRKWFDWGVDCITAAVQGIDIPKKNGAVTAQLGEGVDHFSYVVTDGFISEMDMGTLQRSSKEFLMAQFTIRMLKWDRVEA